MRGQYNNRDALSPNGIRSRSFGGLGRRPPSGRQVPQVASCESRAWRSGSAIIPVGGLPNAMALIVRRCQPSGPSRSPKIYRFTRDRGVVRARLPLPYREGEPESPPSNYREATPFSGKGLFFRVSRTRNVVL
ncbi:hypothetical protein MTP99_002932 [Tenebrio molitor]|nr:hypothetical protein MTP99_002932 [Tenebrio molitor]